MPIPTEPIGSVPRQRELQEAMQAFAAGTLSAEKLDTLFDEAVRETIEQFEATGSPIITDGEQTKPSFATYPLAGLDNLAPDGMIIPFEDGHTRQLPRLIRGPFRYGAYAGSCLPRAKKFASKPLKQAVISASAMSLLYPADGIDGYPQAQFLDDLVRHAVADIRGCFDNGAYDVQIDFTEARLAIKLDSSKRLLQQFIDLNNRVLSHFTAEDRQRIGVHTCPGGDHDSTHSADVDYGELIPLLMTLDVGCFYMQMASERHPERALRVICEHLKPHQRIYVGVINVIDEEVESAETVRDRVLMAAEYIPVAQLGTTDDCGFSPFSDDIATARVTAFAKIQARVRGSELAAEQIGV
ncbi:5-methyltetrahydropteroyltriglutamate--homocysteine methyltransferase [Candidatus Methylomirabilis limnetica]|jgi:5-methyltetrahydropteroyltriglutamate--homocysteine methyltransferase|uniref:5-methyltetrahydropteroyltriglutamate--homocysteine methyltransferase n=1 Tax=Candidatus Methylomirabilis limnetica TaxID=2033718 RepID=A0A2T4U0D6_9BACT|nr:cobalamin-independent methionine synthase II family protein [Candidatus Methylomirabilis limnetica]PTL36830.1 5-methyltetrahydropteroyltriglutamate--homocysteine methyltransferase [Candidatus Methylomirabilis limnetica]